MPTRPPAASQLPLATWARSLADRLIFTPGPTEVAEDVRQALAWPLTNPDLDLDFFDLYERVCRDIATLLHTQNDVLVLSGEGLLGLEAAIASLVTPGDRVLALTNGVYGDGFADLARAYGAEVTLYREPQPGPVSPDRWAANRTPLSASSLAAFLRGYPPGYFRMATLVHCETPTGLLNPVRELLPVLHAAGLLTVMDSVSAIGAEPLATDAWGADVVLGGSQKALSAPPGLSFFSISPAAWAHMGQRQEKGPIRGVYLNLWLWHEMWIERQRARVATPPGSSTIVSPAAAAPDTAPEFPYTPPISDIYGLAVAVRRALAEGESVRLERHRRVARAVRAGLQQLGFEFYPEAGGTANSVTAFIVPSALRAQEQEIRRRLWEEEGVLMAGSWGPYAGRLWRAGHMGENARPEKAWRFLRALAHVLAAYDWPPEAAGAGRGRSAAEAEAQALTAFEQAL